MSYEKKISRAEPDLVVIVQNDNDSMSARTEGSGAAPVQDDHGAAGGGSRPGLGGGAAHWNRTRGPAAAATGGVAEEEWVSGANRAAEVTRSAKGLLAELNEGLAGAVDRTLALDRKSVV